MDIKLPFTAYIAVSHFEKRTQDGLAPGAFVIVTSGRTAHWGMGGIKNTELLFAHAINEIHECGLFSPDYTFLELVVRNPGSLGYFDGHIWIWRGEVAKGKSLKKDGADTWLLADTYLKSVNGRMRTPLDRSERRILDAASTLAKKLARKCLLKGAYRRTGVAETGRETSTL